MNLGAISVPFIFSFHPKLRFDKQWKSFWPATIAVAIFFLIWDAYFTAWGIWGFNDRYILGQRIFGMPYEELAFFICIPYACLFTYHCFSIFLSDRFRGSPGWSHWIVVGICLLFILFGWGHYYTISTAVLLLVLYGFHLLYWKSTYLNLFLITYAILLVPFLIVNGILTGTGIEEEVVWYDDSHNLSTRLFTIPIEDIFYGMLLILGIVTIYEKIKSSKSESS